MSLPLGRSAHRGAVLLLSLSLAACSGAHDALDAPLAISLTSAAFRANGAIPAVHTCDGGDRSPALAWSGVPSKAKSLALIVDDPDAPRGTWVHWVIYDIPPTANGLPEGAGSSGGAVPRGTRRGSNDFERDGYGGPCPPSGRHRYVHKLYALDVLLPDLHEPRKGDLERAMEGHVLARGELVGTYERARTGG
ncbi:MAG TPA: YbhB/YbcL family Raf kinase inhibitor-like protein [Longimicrobiaceae bacterium]|nr:YbhB/YbcL family Raf kinase inhibitor-like protein [Longimicrobiaceae bacterium]